MRGKVVPGPPVQLWLEPYTLETGAVKYCVLNRRRYLQFGGHITPDLEDWRQVWDRVAFAILSANTKFESAALALQYASTHKGRCRDFEIREYRMTGKKAGYLNMLPRNKRCLRDCLRTDTESWDGYRLRLAKQHTGLALTKATFAACLLYPLDADLACVDVHIARLFTGQAKLLRHKDYIRVEAGIRDIGQRAGLPTFLTQWALWDWSRGRREAHDIWPVY